MTQCLSCGKTNDSWRAYCSTCQQTQAFTKLLQQQGSSRSNNAAPGASIVINIGSAQRSSEPIKLGPPLIAKMDPNYKGPTAKDYERQIMADLEAPLSQRVRKFFTKLKFW